MAKTIPNNFQFTTEGVIASYDFNDIAEGTGVVEFCGARWENDVPSSGYFLTTNKQLYSADHGELTLNGFTGNFDITFNVPKIIDGIAYLRVPVGLYAQTDSRNGFTECILYKSGATTIETIGAKQTASSSANNTAHINSHVIYWNIPPTRFRVGDSLRLYISGSASGGSGSTADVIYMNPSGSYNSSFYSAGDLSGRLSLFIPFRLDI